MKGSRRSTRKHNDNNTEQRIRSEKASENYKLKNCIKSTFMSGNVYNRVTWQHHEYEYMNNLAIVLDEKTFCLTIS